MQDEAILFKVLSDPTRLRLSVLLVFRGEICVCMLSQALIEPDFKVSRHLGIMRSAGLVNAVFETKLDYIDRMTEWRGSHYNEIARHLPPGAKLSDFVISLDITASKPNV